MDDFRAQKVQAIRESGRVPYAATFERTHSLAEGKDVKDKKKLAVAGRVMLHREMGKMTFLTLQDHTGRLQVILKEDVIGEDAYKRAKEWIDLGDIIGVSGEHFTTKKGEPSVLASEWTMLTKALRQPPEKWHGIADQETAWRQRYLDTMSNNEAFERFKARSTFVKLLREFYWKNDFVEVDTPVLVNAASGALATPFQTHHEAYDMDVYLRIATETFLKECLVGGFDRVFEVGRVFRNEGLDPSHLQDFTMVEHYAAYWDYVKNMEFTEEMLQSIVKEMYGDTKVEIPDRDGNLTKVDFKPPWPRVRIDDLIKEHCGIDINEYDSAAALRKAIEKAKVQLEVDISALGRGNLIDQLYKKVARPCILQPTFVIEHPIDLSPLARRNDENPEITDRFQLVVGTWEIINAYSELIDPIDQANRFDEQAKAHADGDSDAHRKDDEYVKALEYGCPPCSGWGMGVDRIVALLTQQTNLRDVVLFPLMKPEGVSSRAESRDDTVSNFDSAQSDTGKNATTASSPSLPMATGLLQHADYGHLLPAAHGLLEEHTENTKAHLIATGAAMAALAKKFGGHEDTWRVAGMLHDLDWDSLDKDFEKHCGEELEEMLKKIDAPQELLGDIRAHYAHRYGEEYPLDTMLRKCLYCVDELTGFIIAVTLVRPSKAIADVKVSSVKKKLKDKAFAAQVDREQVKRCEELLEIPLDEFIEITLNAMKEVADDLGL